jgi:small subunit ribosomal protein S4e
MVKNHLLRISAPKTWKISRKLSRYITRPNPGSHSFNSGLSINTVLKEVLGVVDTTKDTKYLINNKGVLINGKSLKSFKHSVGMMDVLSLPKLKQNYRVILNTRGKLDFVSVTDDSVHVAKLTGKFDSRGKKQTLSLHDGTVVLDDSPCKVGDSLLFESGKLKKVISFDVGSFVLLTGGNHIGVNGKIKRAFIEGGVRKIELNSSGDSVITLEKFAFVLGKDKSEVQISND